MPELEEERERYQKEERERCQNESRPRRAGARLSLPLSISWSSHPIDRTRFGSQSFGYGIQDLGCGLRVRSIGWDLSVSPCEHVLHVFSKAHLIPVHI